MSRVALQPIYSFREAAVASLPLRTSAPAHMFAHMLEAELVERHVKLFRNGQNQAVRIPRDLELPGNEAILKKDGDKLTLEPVPKNTVERLLAVLATLDDLPPDECLPEIDDPPPEAFDL